jgi:hypothetical protein
MTKIIKIPISVAIFCAAHVALGLNHPKAERWL